MGQRSGFRGRRPEVGPPGWCEVCDSPIFRVE
uniref:Uncharacterized protein n=1 Tax=Anguilla anguilla TaxID=7936 RepID=A0A0E9PHL2_ANGAN